MTRWSFTHDGRTPRVVFGAGRVGQIAAEVERLGIAHALVICTPGRRAVADRALADLGARGAGICERAVMHVPVEVAGEAREDARRLAADGLVAIGGGSPIGLAKAVALELDLPIVAVPTTYAGSEMTTILGLTEGGAKRTLRDPRVLPRTVIYDPELTAGMPASVAGPSGMNAIAHCVEALYAKDGDPVTALMAEEGVRALAAGLPAVVHGTGDPAAQAETLYGAWLAGRALGAVAMALHHKLCHVLGGSFDLPHAGTHAAVLPHAAAYNSAAAPDAMARVARALGAGSAPQALFDLATGLGIPMRLADLGLAESDLDRAADLAVRDAYPNPRPLEREAIRALLDDAFFGRRPAV